MTLPKDAKARKATPIATGFLDYFPDAIADIAACSRAGNDQHHPDEPLHWDRAKSTDEPDAMMRHFMERGTRDTDGIRHSTKMAWRALALLQKEIEAEAQLVITTHLLCPRCTAPCSDYTSCGHVDCPMPEIQKPRSVANRYASAADNADGWTVSPEGFLVRDGRKPA
jgi:hypothetical protein